MNWDQLLFYAVFLGQIFVISWYYPNKIVARMKRVKSEYPPDQYPKLYPQPAELKALGHSAFVLINRLVFALGFVVLFLLLFVIDHSGFADDGYISEFWPATYGIIQFIPLLLLEFAELKQLQRMRAVNQSRTRTAELSPRKLFNYVSPMIVLSAVSLFLLTIGFDFYINRDVLSWGHDAVQRGIVLAVTSLLLVGVGAFNLYGKKQNPHQSEADRTRQIGANLTSLFYSGMAMCIYFIWTAADDAFDLDFLDATVLSIYFQIIVTVSLGHLLRSLSIDDVDFEVYKEDQAVASL